jgi:HK97 family phage major capsid protein
MALVIKTVRDELREASEEAKAIMGKAEQEDRLLTDDEKKHIEDLVTKAETLQGKLQGIESQKALGDRLERMYQLGAKPADLRPAIEPNLAPMYKSMGQQFVDSPLYAAFKATSRAGVWILGPIELKATTMTPTGGVIPTSFLPTAPQRPPQMRVASLIASGTLSDGSAVPYLRETVYTNMAATVAQAAAKPESTLTFEQVLDPLRTIAHFLPVADQLLEDADGIRSYIDTQLINGVIAVEESQIIIGDGVAPNVRGFKNVTGLATAVTKGATEGYADAIHRQIMAILTASLTMPDGLAIHPSAWHLLATERGAAGGGYLSGGNWLTEPTRQVWGLPVALTPYLDADEALVGAFATKSQIWRKGGIVVSASNSHADFFIKNLTAIRAEERVQLAVYRPSAFGIVDGLVAPV